MYSFLARTLRFSPKPLTWAESLLMVAYVVASVLVAAKVQELFFGQEFSQVPYTIAFAALITFLPYVGYRTICAVRHMREVQRETNHRD
ncbi:hypothetical protein MIC97_20320 [Aquamicrobium sp. NLF2-7]|uniref:hypothetical protein n=1 Tax=Aquamicrobium sp. NLF2-7 TaxID=2918753 RepID=UPI001EFA9B31|nr:hypothetical protein [Aquamicrobium sp. NLF2-7]MCG8273833.1 hypothetical protein [Aquamicrobium sp. NLF2-7]